MARSTAPAPRDSASSDACDAEDGERAREGAAQVVGADARTLVGDGLPTLAERGNEVHLVIDAVRRGVVDADGEVVGAASAGLLEAGAERGAVQLRAAAIERGHPGLLDSHAAVRL